MEQWKAKHEETWDKCFDFKPQLESILTMAKDEDGFVSKKQYDLNPLGSAASVFNEMQEVLEDQTQRV